MKKYTILTYNIGGYEEFREVKNPSDICEYIYITDNKSITSSTWNVIYVENEHPEDNFDICYKIRYEDMWKYVSTDVLIRIDGSLEPFGNTDELYERFINNGSDICLQIHPERDTISNEARAWETIKHYPKKQNERVLNFMKRCGYDVEKYKGLYQLNFSIQRRCDFCMDLNRLVFALMKHFALEGKLIDTNDQLIFAFVLHTMFPDAKVMFVDVSVSDTLFFNCYRHGGNSKFSYHRNGAKKYAFNKEISTEEF